MLHQEHFNDRESTEYAELEENIVQFFQEVFDDSNLRLSPDTILEELNASSMQSVLVVSRVEERYNIELPMPDYYSLVTFKDLIIYVCDRITK